MSETSGLIDRYIKEPVSKIFRQKHEQNPYIELKKKGFEKTTNLADLVVRENFENDNAVKGWMKGIGVRTSSIRLEKQSESIELLELAYPGTVFFPKEETTDDPGLSAFYHSETGRIGYDLDLFSQEDGLVKLLHEIGHSHQDNHEDVLEAKITIFHSMEALITGAKIEDEKVGNALKTIAASERDAWLFALKKHDDFLEKKFNITPNLNEDGIKSLAKEWLLTYKSGLDVFDMFLGEGYVEGIFMRDWE